MLNNPSYVSTDKSDSSRVCDKLPVSEVIQRRIFAVYNSLYRYSGSTFILHPDRYCIIRFLLCPPFLLPSCRFFDVRSREMPVEMVEHDFPWRYPEFPHPNEKMVCHFKRLRQFTVTHDSIFFIESK